MPIRRTSMADIEKLQAALFAEMKARIKEDDESVPSPDGPFEYYTRFVTGGQHPLFCRKPRKGSEERVLIDGNALAAGHAYFRIGGVSHSPDHKLIAYAVDTKGSEFFTIRIVDAETGALVDTNITDTNGDMQWDNDSSGLFYIWVDDEHRPRRVLRHVVGADATDAVIRDQKDPGFFLGIDSTQSRRFLLLSVHDHETSEVSIIDTEKPRDETRARGQARSRTRLFRGASRRQIDHSHQFRRRRGLSHCRSADRPSRSRELARDRAAQARAPDPRRRRLQKSPRTPRARRRIAAHRHSPFRRWPRAYDRISGRSLFARPFARLRIRYDDAPLHLFVDDHARASLRLRYGDERAKIAQDAASPLGPRSIALCHAQGRWPRRKTESSCPFRCSIAKT